jgi:hypothetical protein
VYWSRDPEGSLTGQGSYLCYTHTHTHTVTHTHTHIGGFFLSPRMHPIVDAGVCLSSSVPRFGLTNTNTTLDFLDDCLFSPKCQRISIDFLENRIFGVGMRESFTGEVTGPVDRPTFVPPISNVTPIHGYFFTGEETGSADRAGGLTCGLVFRCYYRRGLTEIYTR